MPHSRKPKADSEPSKSKQLAKRPPTTKKSLIEAQQQKVRDTKEVLERKVKAIKSLSADISKQEKHAHMVTWMQRQDQHRYAVMDLAKLYERLYPGDLTMAKTIWAQHQKLKDCPVRKAYLNYEIAEGLEPPPGTRISMEDF